MVSATTLVRLTVNHDGVSQPEEILSLDQSNVTGIALAYHWTGRRDQFGNIFRYESLVFFGRNDTRTSKPFYDIFFAAVNR